MSGCKPHRATLMEMRPPEWATIIPSRGWGGDAVKIHKTAGQAYAAVTCSSPSPEWQTENKGVGYPSNYSGEAEIYQRVSDRWILFMRIEDGTLKSDLPWKKKKKRATT